MYNTVIERYSGEWSKLSFGKSVDQIGDVRDPGISDLDLVVVVDECYDPLKIGMLSIFRNNIHSQTKNTFLHDIYLYNQHSFKRILYSNYCDNMKLLYGIEQQLDIPDRSELDILSMQIIFDFVA